MRLRCQARIELVVRLGWRELFFEFDDAVPIVDADGTKLTEDVLSKEAVKLGAEALRQVVQMHDGDRLGKKELVSNFQVDSDADGVAHNAHLPADGPRGSHQASAIGSGIKDGPVRTGVEQERHAVSIYFGFDEKQGLDGAKREKDRSWARGGRQRQEQAERRTNCC